MNRENVMAPPAPAPPRKAARNAGEILSPLVSGVPSEPIYKGNRMHTVGAMGKRILTLATGVLLGALLFPAGLRLAVLWGLFPNRDLNHASSYLREALQVVNENYVDPKAADYDSLVRAALHGMADSLDPHSEFLEAKDDAALEEDLTGEFGGIGVEVEEHSSRVLVVGLVAGAPGDRSGIRRGDEITSIAGHRLGPGVDLENVVDQLRGKPNTRVSLGLLRPANGKSYEVTLTRETIKENSVG